MADEKDAPVGALDAARSFNDSWSLGGWKYVAATMRSVFQGGNISDNVKFEADRIARFRREQPLATVATDTAGLGASFVMGSGLAKLGSAAISDGAAFVRGAFATPKPAGVAKQVASATGASIEARTSALINAIDEKIASGTAEPLVGRHAMARPPGRGFQRTGNPALPAVPWDISLKRMNYGILDLVKRINAGEYDALKAARPEEYERMIQALTDRIGVEKFSTRTKRFPLSDPKLADTPTIAPILRLKDQTFREGKMHAIVDYDYKDWQQLLSRGNSDRLIRRLEQDPEIKARHLQDIRKYGDEEAPLRDSHGQIELNDQGFPRLRARTPDEKHLIATNVLNQLDLAWYRGVQMGGKLEPYAGSLETSGAVSAALNTVKRGLSFLTTPNRFFNDHLPWGFAWPAKAVYTTVVGGATVWGLGVMGDKTGLPVLAFPQEIVENMALRTDPATGKTPPWARNVMDGVEFAWPDAKLGETKAQAEFAVQTSKSRTGEEADVNIDKLRNLPVAGSPASQPPNQTQSKMPLYRQQLRAAGVPDDEIEKSARDYCIMKNDPSQCTP